VSISRWGKIFTFIQDRVVKEVKKAGKYCYYSSKVSLNFRNRKLAGFYMI